MISLGKESPSASDDADDDEDDVAGHQASGPAKVYVMPIGATEGDTLLPAKPIEPAHTGERLVDQKHQWSLCLLRGPHGIVLAEHQLSSHTYSGVSLSADGRWAARAEPCCLFSGPACWY